MKKLAIAIIQARMSSSRLPGKVMMPLAGQPMIWHIVQRARACTLVDKVIVVTSVETSDDPLADFCKNSDILYRRGNLQNVLSRFIDVLEDDPHPYYVRITGDCPLIDPDFIDQQIRALVAYDGDSAWTDPVSSVFSGQGVHSTRSLKKVAQSSDHPDDLEHVGARYFAEHPDEFRLIGIQMPEYATDLTFRLTVDEGGDLALMDALYEALWQGSPISLQVALEWLQKNPEAAVQNESITDSLINLELKKLNSKKKQFVEFSRDDSRDDH